MPKWHIDYFELKWLKKQPVQQGHSDPPFCLTESRKQISHVKGTLPVQEVERHSYHKREGIQGQEACKKQTWLVLHNLLTQAQVSVSCQFFTNSLFLCLRSRKLPALAVSWVPYPWDPCMYNLDLILFLLLLLFCLAAIELLDQSKELRRAGVTSPSPTAGIVSRILAGPYFPVSLLQLRNPGTSDKGL